MRSVFREVEKAAKKEKKKKAKKVRDKKMTQELERWMKKTQELKEEEASKEAAASEKKMKISISFGGAAKGAQHQPSEETPVSSGFVPVIVPGLNDGDAMAADMPRQPAQFLPVNDGTTPMTEANASETAAPSGFQPVNYVETAQPSQTAVAETAGATPDAPAFPQVSARPDVGLDYVCILCRRKFAKARTLLLHNERSVLHKVLPLILPPAFACYSRRSSGERGTGP